MLTHFSKHTNKMLHPHVQFQAGTLQNSWGTILYIFLRKWEMGAEIYWNMQTEQSQA